MNTEKSPCLFSMGSSFFPEARRESGIKYRELLTGLVEQCTSVVCRDRLLGSRNEVLILSLSRHFVKFLVELRELGSLCHHVLLHEKWCHELLVASGAKESKTIVNEGKVEIDSCVCQEISTVTGNSGTTLLIVTVYPSQDFMVR
jgi:hypothetical protein